MFSSETAAYPTNAWLPVVVVLVYYLVGGYLSFTYGNAFLGFSVFLLFTASICSRWRGMVLAAGPRTTRQIPPQPIPKCIQLSATELHEAFKEGSLRCVDVTMAYIRLIRAVNPYINAMVFDCFEEAIRTARRADVVWEEWRSKGQQAGEPEPSFVLGVPCTVKECMLCTGCPNTSGNPKREGLISKRDSHVVSNFRCAGAVILGVTNTSELCMWYESSNYVYGMSSNPYDTRCIVGGSSGGEGAAAGASFACFGIGSDIGGSIRMPAFFNGVYGFKATPHLIDNEGQFPGARASANRFMAIGPITRFAEDLFPLSRVAAMGGVSLPPEEYPPAAPFSLRTSWPLTPWDRYYYARGVGSSVAEDSFSLLSFSSTSSSPVRLVAHPVPAGWKKKSTPRRPPAARRGKARSTAVAAVVAGEGEEEMDEAMEEKIEFSKEAATVWKERKQQKTSFMTTLPKEEDNFPWELERKNAELDEFEEAEAKRKGRGARPRTAAMYEKGRREVGGGSVPLFSLSSFSSSSPTAVPARGEEGGYTTALAPTSSSPLPPTLRIFALEDYGVRFIPVSHSQKMAVHIAAEALAGAMRNAGVPVEVMYINVRDPKRCTGGVVPPPFQYFSDSFSMWVHALSSDPSENSFVSSMEDGGDGDRYGVGMGGIDDLGSHHQGRGEVNWVAELGRWCLRRSRHTFPAISLCVLETLEKSVPKFLTVGRTGSHSLEYFQRQMEDLLGEHGVLIAPTFPTAAPRHHQPLWNPFQFQYTAVFNVLQLPAVACPIWVGESMAHRRQGYTPEAVREEGRPEDFHLPKGVQLVGKRNTDEMLLGLALVLDEQCQGYRYPGWAELKTH